jgi:2-oxoglutarate/2-oxoacid ferredoxin oxidoreductase subunit alpha
MTSKQVDLTKNFFALGLMFWLYERSMEPTLRWIERSSPKRPVIAEANRARSRPATPSARRPRCSTPPTASRRRSSPRAPTATSPATRRRRSASSPHRGWPGATLVYGSYPITPASDILHQLATYKNFGVKTFQAEDEIAAIGSAIGASTAAHMGLTASSGPGIALKSEALNLAVMVELPLVVVDVQRAGPSTGMPTKTEQADLLRRCSAATATRRCRSSRRRRRPSASTTPSRPGDRAQVHDPGVYLSDAFLATGAEPWRIPSVADLPDISVGQHTDRATSSPTPATRRRSPGRGPCPARPASSTASAASRRPTSPATSATTRRTTTGCSAARGREGRRHRRRHPAARGLRPRAGDLLVLGWGSTYGAIRSAVERLQARAGASPTRTCAPQPVPAQHRRGAPRYRACSSRRSTWASCRCSAGALPVDVIGLQQGPRQALPDRRDRSGRGGARRPRSRTAGASEDGRSRPPDDRARADGHAGPSRLLSPGERGRSSS